MQCKFQNASVPHQRQNSNPLSTKSNSCDVADLRVFAVFVEEIQICLTHVTIASFTSSCQDSHTQCTTAMAHSHESLVVLSSTLVWNSVSHSWNSAYKLRRLRNKPREPACNNRRQPLKLQRTVPASWWDDRMTPEPPTCEKYRGTSRIAWTSEWVPKLPLPVHGRLR